MKRFPKKKSYVVILAALGGSATAWAANTPDVFTGGAAANGTALTTTTNWSLAAVPVITNDAEFGTAYPASGKTLTTTITGATATYGSLDDLNINGAVTVGDGTSAASASTITLGGSGDLGNSLSGTAADLIYTASGATLNIVPNASTGTGALSLVLGQTGVFDSVGTLSVTAAISGSFGVVKTGVGSLTLGNSNTFTGGVNFSAGTLNINAGSALGTTAGIFTIGAGTTLDNTSGASVTTNAIVANIGTGFTFKGTNNLAFGGVANFSTGAATTVNVSAGTLTFSNLTNASGGTITKIGAGTLSLGTSNNAFTANINLSGGTLQVYGGANLGASASTETLLANSTIQFSSNVGISGSGGAHTFNTGTGNMLSLDPQSLSVQLGNLIIGSGGITKVGTGTITLNAAETYTGPTVINSGTLNNTTTSTLASTALVLNGGTLSFNTGHTNTQNFSTTAFNAGINTISIPAFSTAGLTLGLGTISRLSGATVDFTLPTTGSITTTTSNPVFAGGQASILGGYATVGGTTWATVSGGTISGLTTYDNTFAVPGADVDVTGTVNQDPSVTATNSVRFNTAASTVLNISSGGLAIATGGILETSAVGANVSNISGGTLTSNNGADLIVIQNNVAAPLIISSAITNSSTGASIGLTKTGAGMLIVAGTNTNTGPTNILAGTLTVGVGGTTEALGSGAVLDNGILAFNQSGITTFNNAISGTGILQQNGVGTLVLTVTNSYTGGTSFNAGVVQASTTNFVGFGNFNFSGGAFRQTATLNSARLLAFNSGGGTVDVSNGATFSLTNSGAITGSGIFNVNNATTSSTTGAADNGTLSISTLSSSFTGPININAGALDLFSVANTYAGSFNVSTNALLYGYAGGSFGSAAITLGAGRLEINNASTTSNYASTLASNLLLTSTTGTTSTIQIGTSTYPNTLTDSGAVSGGGSLTRQALALSYLLMQREIRTPAAQL